MIQSRSGRASAQRGISFIGMLFTAAMFVCIGWVVAQVIPTVIEYQAIDKAANRATSGTTVLEVRAIFNRAKSIDNFQSVDGKDLDVQKIGDKVVVSYAYVQEIKLFGPVSLLLRYKGQSR